MTLQIQQVSKRYGADHWALRDVTFQMDQGVVGLVGPNGAGKTTLLRILASLALPTMGAVYWDGQDIIRSPLAMRRTLGYVPQDFGVYPQLTAYEFLTYIGELKGLKGAFLHRRVAQVLADVGMQEYADWRLRRFSGGMIRRIAIAQALLNEPRLLILDEPTAGLDPSERMRFRELLVPLQGDRLIVLSTHIISDVEATATHLLILQQGRCIWSGSPTGLLADAAETVWSLNASPTEFAQLRLQHRVSAAVPHGDMIALRLIAREQPFPHAQAVVPTLEEAYLFFANTISEA